MSLKNTKPIKWVPSLYFAMGLPFVILSLVSVILLDDLGISQTKIAFVTSIVILPYSLKPLWSPLLELFSTKKRIVVFCQFGAAVGLSLFAFFIQLSNFMVYVSIILFLIGLVGATHDIAADGIYLSVLDKKMQSKYIGWQGAFYNLAKVLANGLFVWLAGYLIRYFYTINATHAAQYAWGLNLIVLSGVLLIIAIYHLFNLPSKEIKNTSTQSVSSVMNEVWYVFKMFFKKKHIVLYIVFIISYRLTEGLAIKMIPIFLKASIENGGLGLSNQTIGLIYGTLGTIAFIVGSILGGYYISHFSLKKTLLSLVFIYNVPYLIYFVFAYFQPTNLWLISAGLVFEYFCYGFGFVGLTLFMMQQVAPGKHSMAHYAFATAIMNLGFMLPSMVSGYLCERLGYTLFFQFALICAIPVFILAYKLPFSNQE